MRARSAAVLVRKRPRDVVRHLVAAPAQDVEHDNVDAASPHGIEEWQRHARQQLQQDGASCTLGADPRQVDGS